MKAPVPVTIARVLAGEARWAVEQGDSFELLRRMPDDCVDHTIADPPYDERTSRNARTHAGAIRKRSPGSSAAQLKRRRFVPFEGMQPAAILGSVLRVTGRWSLLFCSLEQLGDYAHAATTAWVRAGVWHRVGGAPQFSGDRPAQGAEGLAIVHAPGRKRWNGGGSTAFWEYPRAGSGARLQAVERVHPTQKPVELMVDLVGLFTDPDDLVLDPFCGSGTTGIACLRQGRRFVGIEIEPRWAKLATQRLQAEQQCSSLGAVRAGQQPLFRDAAAGGAR
jgi:site-specific DNA-methyltransferase (adenine-specific)